MKHMRIVCGYCSVDTDDLPQYLRNQHGHFEAMQQHLIEEHGLTLTDFQENIRRDPPVGEDSEDTWVYEWFFVRDNTLCTWSEKV
jgi:hypothetical protein